MIINVNRVKDVLQIRPTSVPPKKQGGEQEKPGDILPQRGKISPNLLFSTHSRGKGPGGIGIFTKTELAVK
jgi:hypothetical protein